MELWYADDLIDDAVMRVICAGAVGVREEVLRTAYSLPTEGAPLGVADLDDEERSESLASLVLRELCDHPYISAVDREGYRAFVASDAARASVLGLQRGNSVLYNDQQYGLAKRVLERIAQGGPWGVTSNQLSKNLSLHPKVLANQIERLLAAGLVWKGVVWELNELYNPNNMQLSGSSGFRGVRTNLLKLKRYEGPEPCQPGLRYEGTDRDKYQFAASIVRYMLAEGLDEVPERIICEHFGLSTKKIVNFRNWLKRKTGPLRSEKRKVSLQESNGVEGKHRERALFCFVVTGQNWQGDEESLLLPGEGPGRAAWEVGVAKAVSQVIAMSGEAKVKAPYIANELGIGVKALHQYGVSQMLAKETGSSVPPDPTDAKAPAAGLVKVDPIEIVQTGRKRSQPLTRIEQDVESILQPLLEGKIHQRRILEVKEVEQDLESEFSVAGIELRKDQIRDAIDRVAKRMKLRLDKVVVREQSRSFTVEILRVADVADSSAELEEFLGKKRIENRKQLEVLSSEARSPYVKTAALRTLGYDDVPARRLRDLHIYLLQQANTHLWSSAEREESKESETYLACSLCDEKCVVTAGVSVCTNCGATLPSLERSRSSESGTVFSEESSIPDLQDCILQMPISTVFRIVGIFGDRQRLAKELTPPSRTTELLELEKAVQEAAGEAHTLQSLNNEAPHVAAMVADLDAVTERISQMTMNLQALRVLTTSECVGSNDSDRLKVRLVLHQQVSVPVCAKDGSGDLIRIEAFDFKILAVKDVHAFWACLRCCVLRKRPPPEVYWHGRFIESNVRLTELVVQPEVKERFSLIDRKILWLRYFPRTRSSVKRRGQRSTDSSAGQPAEQKRESVLRHQKQKFRDALPWTEMLLAHDATESVGPFGPKKGPQASMRWTTRDTEKFMRTFMSEIRADVDDYNFSGTVTGVPFSDVQRALEIDLERRRCQERFEVSMAELNSLRREKVLLESCTTTSESNNVAAIEMVQTKINEKQAEVREKNEACKNALQRKKERENLKLKKKQIREYIASAGSTSTSFLGLCGPFSSVACRGQDSAIFRVILHDVRRSLKAKENDPLWQDDLNVLNVIDTPEGGIMETVRRRQELEPPAHSHGEGNLFEGTRKTIVGESLFSFLGYAKLMMYLLTPPDSLGDLLESKTASGEDSRITEKLAGLEQIDTDTAHRILSRMADRGWILDKEHNFAAVEKLLSREHDTTVRLFKTYTGCLRSLILSPRFWSSLVAREKGSGLGYVESPSEIAMDGKYSYLSSSKVPGEDLYDVYALPLIASHAHEDLEAAVHLGEPATNAEEAPGDLQGCKTMIRKRTSRPGPCSYSLGSPFKRCRVDAVKEELAPVLEQLMDEIRGAGSGGLDLRYIALQVADGIAGGDGLRYFLQMQTQQRRKIVVASAGPQLRVIAREYASPWVLGGGVTDKGARPFVARSFLELSGRVNPAGVQALCKIYDACFLCPGISLAKVLSSIEVFWPSETSLLVLALSEVGAISLRRSRCGSDCAYLPFSLGDSVFCADDGMSKVSLAVKWLESMPFG